MHSLCCWPPERRRAGTVEVAGDLVVEPCSPQRVDHQRLQLAPARLLARLFAQGKGHVVEDRHREGVGLLEDHRHSRAQLCVLQGVDVLAVEHDRARARGARGQLGEPVERAQQARLAATGRADQGQHLALMDRHGDGVDGALATVVDAHVIQAQALGALGRQRLADRLALLRRGYRRRLAVEHDRAHRRDHVVLGGLHWPRRDDRLRLAVRARRRSNSSLQPSPSWLQGSSSVLSALIFYILHRTSQVSNQSRLCQRSVASPPAAAARALEIDSRRSAEAGLMSVPRRLGSRWSVLACG